MILTSLVEQADCVFIQTPPTELSHDADLQDVWAGRWVSQAYSFDLSWTKEAKSYRLSGLLSHGSKPLIMVGSVCLLDKHQQRYKGLLERTGRFVFTGLKKENYSLGFTFESHEVFICLPNNTDR